MLGTVAATDEHRWRASMAHAKRSATRDATRKEKERENVTDDAPPIFEKVRWGKHRGKIVRVSTTEWRDRLSDKIRALGTWARVMRIAERRRAHERKWQWLRTARAEREKEKREEDRAKEERERERERQDRAASDGQRHSGRLIEQRRRDYNEAKRKTRKTTEMQRRAVPTQHSARVGIRLWWWMESGDGWDASGPMSVRRGAQTSDGRRETHGRERKKGDG